MFASFRLLYDMKFKIKLLPPNKTQYEYAEYFPEGNIFGMVELEYDVVDDNFNIIGKFGIDYNQQMIIISIN